MDYKRIKAELSEFWKYGPKCPW